jgi:hypothetical protein
MNMPTPFGKKEIKVSTWLLMMKILKMDIRKPRKARNTSKSGELAGQ